MCYVELQPEHLSPQTKVIWSLEFSLGQIKDSINNKIWNRNGWNLKLVWIWIILMAWRICSYFNHHSRLLTRCGRPSLQSPQWTRNIKAKVGSVYRFEQQVGKAPAQIWGEMRCPCSHLSVFVPAAPCTTLQGRRVPWMRPGEALRSCGLKQAQGETARRNCRVWVLTVWCFPCGICLPACSCAAMRAW